MLLSMLVQPAGRAYPEKRVGRDIDHAGDRLRPVRLSLTVSPSGRQMNTGQLPAAQLVPERLGQGVDQLG